VSAGNRADVSGNDLLQYWETDAATTVVLLYLESFGNPRKFARLARRLARHKPVVVVKSGRHAVVPGLAASSVPVDDASVRALFEQSGVIRVESLAELFDTALLLANQPLAKGERVAVVGNSTAIGLLAADTVLAQHLPLAADPVDTGAEASPEAFAAAVRDVLCREDVDAVVIVFVPPLAVPGAEYARALRAVVDDGAAANKPVVSTFLAVEGVPAELAVAGPDGTPGYGSVPSYPSPERAVTALARAIRYARWRSAPQGEYVRPDDIRVDEARELVAKVMSTHDGGHTTLSDADSVRLLGCYGIDVVPFRRVTNESDAVAAAAALGCPVAVKSTSEQLRHRPDLVGVRLDLATEDAVRAAYRDVRAVSGVDDVIVQCMAERGVSCVIGLQDDPSFGSLVYFGLSGIVSDLLGDRAYGAVPLTDADAARLVRSPMSAPLLAGYRGAEPRDLAALADLVLRVAALSEDLPGVRSLTLDPVLALTSGVAVTSARIVLGPPPPRPDSVPRQLRSIGGAA
jgi:acyl-CoA synthetase (NDP forming)